MRAILLLLALLGLSLILQADEGDTTADDRSAEAEAATREAEEAPAPVAPVRSDDRFMPTDRLRHDQEVDYPTDI